MASERDAAKEYGEKMMFVGIAERLEMAFRDGAKWGSEEEWKAIRQWKPYLHYCCQWNGMLIDKGQPEFDCCTCFGPTSNANQENKKE